MAFQSQEYLQVFLDDVSHPIKMCIDLVEYSNVTTEVVTSSAIRSYSFAVGLGIK